MDCEDIINDNKVTLTKIENNLKINWTNFMIYENDIRGDLDSNFEIKPLEWLRYSKESFSTGTIKGRVDGLSNAKRAIECQIDSLISYIGYDYKIFDNSTEYTTTKKYIKQNYKGKDVIGVTDRVKFLNILGLAPLYLVSKIRNLRNIMEHEYIIPREEEVKEAIEVAEVFVHASERKISFMITCLLFGSNFKKNSYSRKDNTIYEEYCMYPKYLLLNFYSGGNGFILSCVDKHPDDFPQRQPYYDDCWCEITVNDDIYPHLLYVVISQDYKELPRILSCKTPSNYVKYIVEHS